MFPLDSIFVTGRPSSRFPHVVVRCRDTDLFVLKRLPQFSNNVTSHVEKRGPGLAFESPGFWQTSAFTVRLIIFVTIGTLVSPSSCPFAG